MIHRKFGSSTAARTDACPAWVEQSEGVPRRESEFAQHGTIVHAVAEALSLNEPIPDIVEGARVEADHIELAQELWGAAKAFMESEGVYDYEPEVHASTADDVGGTLDLVGWCENMRTLYLIDHKSGRGVQVEAENNKQILFAAANLIHGDSVLKDLIDDGLFTEFVGVIIQPDEAGQVQTKVWRFDIERVARFWSEHRHNIEEARRGGLEPRAGDHCKFCPANGLCDATTGNLLRMKTIDPDDVEQLTWALSHIEAVKDTIAAVERLAFEQLELGVKIPGWKLVRGRAGATKWIDEDKALRSMKRKARGIRLDGKLASKHMVTQKTITPTQAKALFKKLDLDPAFIDDLSEKGAPTKNVLAPESDKREAVLSAEALSAALNSVG